jgi:hypothetical protein
MVTVLLLFRLCRHGSYVDADGVQSQAGRLGLLFFTNSFESPVLRRSVSDERREIDFAGDQIRSVKFSFERQGSRVTPHIPEQKLDRARERYRVLFTQSPRCLGRCSTPPNFGLRVRHRQSAFSIAFCVKAQETMLVVSKSNLDLPTASHVRRLCLGRDEGEYVHGHYQNYCARCFHVFFYQQFDLRANSLGF